MMKPMELQTNSSLCQNAESLVGLVIKERRVIPYLVKHSNFVHFQMKVAQQLKIYFIYTALFLSFILLSLVANFPHKFKLNLNDNDIKSEDPELKTILLWNAYGTIFDQTFGLR